MNVRRTVPSLIVLAAVGGLAGGGYYLSSHHPDTVAIVLEPLQALKSRVLASPIETAAATPAAPSDLSPPAPEAATEAQVALPVDATFEASPEAPADGAPAAVQAVAAPETLDTLMPPPAGTVSQAPPVEAPAPEMPPVEVGSVKAEAAKPAELVEPAVVAEKPVLKFESELKPDRVAETVHVPEGGEPPVGVADKPAPAKKPAKVARVRPERAPERTSPSRSAPPMTARAPRMNEFYVSSTGRVIPGTRVNISGEGPTYTSSTAGMRLAPGESYGPRAMRTDATADVPAMATPAVGGSPWAAPSQGPMPDMGVRGLPAPAGEVRNLQGWSVRGVNARSAVVAKDGKQYPVAVGSVLPGAGMVTSLDPARLTVMTESGVILAQ